MELLKAESYGQANPQKTEAPHAFTIAAMPIEIQKTELSEIAAKLGGTPGHSGDAGDAFDWLCYASPAGGDAPAMLVWFTSNEMGGDTTLQQIAAERTPAAIPAGCVTLAAPIGLKTTLPGLGAAKADLAKTFGSTNEENGRLDYFYITTDAKSQMSTQSIASYKLGADGAVAAFMLGYLQSM